MPRIYPSIEAVLDKLKNKINNDEELEAIVEEAMNNDEILFFELVEDKDTVLLTRFKRSEITNSLVNDYDILIWYNDKCYRYRGKVE